MKVLLLALALLFTGAHGNFLWQHDKPHEEHGVWKVMENAIAIATETIKNLEYSEIAEKYHIKEKLTAAQDSADHMEKVMVEYYEQLRKRYDENMHQNFPIFMKNVYPKLKEFDDHIEELLKKTAGEILPVTTSFFSGLGGEAKKFWESFSKIAGNTRDKLRIEIDNVRTKISPHAEEVKAELEKYKESMKTNWENKAKNMKDELEKDMEQLKTSFEKFQTEFGPQAKEMRKRLEKLIHDVFEYLIHDDKL